ncbi:MAG: choice-of-anchor J domain-containing protein [Bacteroidales bacterium]|nr:choice-of-anchor J domain-containing protein [Bacteroidales bacterium]
MKKLVSIFVMVMVTSFSLIIFNSCVKQDFDKPPIGIIPIGEVVNIAQLRQIFADSSAYTFTSDYSLYATVVMGEATGNIYKSAYVQDTSGAINIYMKNSGGLTFGDNIRVYLKNCDVSKYGELLQIANVDNDSNIIITGTGNFLEPRMVTISELNDAMESGNFDEYESQLIQFDSVQFSLGDIGKTYADADDYGERFIEDCDFNSVMVRTSDYASFAEELLPEGKGPLVAIAGRYNNTIQLLIRSTLEVKLDGPRCGAGGGGVTSIDEDFSEQQNYEDINIDGWLNVAIEGSRRWQGKTFNDEVYAQATSYNSEEANECWMITVGIDLDAMTNPMAKFETAMAYWEHDGLTVLFSTDFNGANISGASWIELDCTIAGQHDPDHEWIQSGDIDLSGFSGQGYLAFKYVGSDLNGNTTSYRVDDVKVWDTEK